MPNEDFLQDQIEAITLVATWLNAREDLVAPTNFSAEDFRLASYASLFESWRATVITPLIQDALFEVRYDAGLREYQVQQYRRVEEMSISKAELEADRG